MSEHTSLTTPQYIAPRDIADALAIKGKHGAAARFIAGGTDLILRMRDKVLTPELLIDLRHLSLDVIDLDDNGLVLGAAVKIEQILQHAGIKTWYPALTEACRPFAGPPIRNRGTVGGNIVNASPAADLVPALIAYDASIVLASTAGERQLELLDLFTGPGQTVMTPGEVLLTSKLPLVPGRTAASFMKLGHRRSMAISIVNTAVRITLDRDGMVAQSRIVLGAVAPTPIRARDAEHLLEGKAFNDVEIAGAAERASHEISPISDVRASGDYRRRMTAVIVRRALTAVAADLCESPANV